MPTSHGAASPGTACSGSRPALSESQPLCLQGDLQLALKEGHDILESLREPLAEATARGVNQDQLDNQATVQR